LGRNSRTMSKQIQKEKRSDRREIILYLKMNYKGLASVNKLIKEYKKEKAT
jgi:hypothetical protein